MLLIDLVYNQTISQEKRLRLRVRKGPFLFAKERSYIYDMNGFEVVDDVRGNENLFFEKFLGKYFWKTKESVLLAEYKLNRKFSKEGLVSLQDFYNFLDISKDSRSFPKDYGWDIDGTTVKGYGWIDFLHRLMLNEDIPYYVIEYPTAPFNLDIYKKKGEIKCLL